MKSITITVCGLLFLAACAASGVSEQVVDGTRLSVRLDENYYWQQSYGMTSSDGSQVEVEVFPLVEALVVSRVDGDALGPDDEAMARAAVDAHCQAQLLGTTSSSSDFSAGTWAFYPCTAPQG